MIEIECEEPIIDKCVCCNCDVTRLTRFVYQNGDAFAVYYARFDKGHENRIVEGIISLGNWGEGSVSEQRKAFPFRIWIKDDEYQVGLINKNESFWNEVEVLGQILDRDEALLSPWLQDVFHITDHIVTDDQLIVDFFS